MRLPHRLQGQKVKSQGGAGAYCGGDLAAQLVSAVVSHVTDFIHYTCCVFDTQTTKLFVVTEMTLKVTQD